MKEHNKDIEHIFSTKLREHEVEVPDAVWTGISEKFAFENGKLRAINRRRKVVIAFLAVAASLGLLMLVVRYPQKGVKKENYSVVVPEKKGSSDGERNNNHFSDKKIANNQLNNNISAKNQLHFTQHNTFKRSNNPSGDISSNYPRNSHSDNSLSSEVDLKKSESRDPMSNNLVAISKTEQKSKENDSEIVRKTDDFANAAENMAAKLFAEDQKSEKSKKTKKTVNLLVGGGLAIASQNRSSNQLLTLAADASSVSKENNLKNALITNYMTSSSKSEYHLVHSTPLIFSVGISKPLAKFFDLEVGISYSYLYSKQDGESGGVMQQSQQFSYIGLPVALNFKVAEWEKFRFGILMGGNIQKDIQGQLKEQISSSSSGELGTKSIHQKYFQPSLNANLHISYSLNKNVQVFGKFGGAYYFDMNDNYRTIYSDKNFLPDIGFGLTYRLDY